MKTYFDELVELKNEHPDFKIIPRVEAQVVQDDWGFWDGKFDHSEVNAYYYGNKRTHFKTDNIKDVLKDMKGCKYGHDFQGRDINKLSEEEQQNIFNSLPWRDCIIVNITKF